MHTYMSLAPGKVCRQSSGQVKAVAARALAAEQACCCHLQVQPQYFLAALRILPLGGLVGPRQLTVGFEKKKKKWSQRVKLGY